MQPHNFDKDKIGLVLSGGIFRSAFQVGVLEALHERQIFKKWGDKKVHHIPQQYRSRITIIAPTRPLHPICAKKHQIQEAIAEGYAVGKSIAFMG